MFKFFKRGNKVGVKVKVVNENDTGLPAYQTIGSAGVDLFSNVDTLLEPGRPTLVPTGLRFQIPEGYEIQIRSRSGLALKNSVFVLNSPGTIDSDYRGDIGIILMNTGRSAFTIAKGMRIAQAVLQKVERIEWDQVEQLEETERGSGGFGSTKL